MYVVNHGEVDVVQQQAEGGESVVATLTQGAWFGEMALFNEERAAPRSYENHRHVLSVDRRTFQTSHVPRFRALIAASLLHGGSKGKGRGNVGHEGLKRPAIHHDRTLTVVLDGPWRCAGSSLNKPISPKPCALRSTSHDTSPPSAAAARRPPRHQYDVT